MVTFSRPVGRLVILRDGTHSCYDTTIGQVVAYGPGNVELERKPFSLIQTCSDAPPFLREAPTAASNGVSLAASAPYTSPYAPDAEAVLQVPSGVTRLVFLPPEDWYFTFVNPYFPDDVRPMMRQGTYSLVFRADSLAAGHVIITADSATLAQGDTTVFRTTAPGANQWTVTRYSFVPLASVTTAMRGTSALRAQGTASMPRPQYPSVRQREPAVATGGATAVPAERRAHFLDAAVACSDATGPVCYNDPPQTGYEVVTAMVDGVEQRDSVLVRVVPALRVMCAPSVVVRAEVVTCTAAMGDSSAFTPTHRSSVANGEQLVDEELPPDTAIFSYAWRGKAIVTTEVKISAMQGQNSISGRGSFKVVPRTGPEWAGLRIQASVPVPEFIAERPLAANPFPRPGSLWSEDGSIGQYVRVERDNYWGLVAEGPNANLVYTRAPLTTDPPRIFVHAWLQRGSAFYRAQQGNPNVIGAGPCTGADIDRLRVNAVAHEVRHHTADVDFFIKNDVRKLLEAATARFDIRQLDDSVKLAATQRAAYDAAFGSAWAAAVSTSVDHDHPVDTPSCRSRQP